MGCLSSKTKVEEINVTATDPKMSASSDYEYPVAVKRGCTDIIFLIFFLAFIGGMGYVSYRAIAEGDPYRLIYGYDSWGNVCGRKNNPISNVSLSGIDMTDRGKTFFYDENYFFKKVLPLLSPGPETFTLPPVLSSWTPGSVLTSTDPVVCVASCPNVTLSTTSEKAYLCSYRAPSTCPSSTVYPHKTLLNRCVPESFFAMTAAVSSSIKSVVSGDVAQKIFADIQSTWKEQLYLAAISFGVALLIVILLKFLAAVIIWGVTVFMVLIAFAAAGYSWYNWYEKKSMLDEETVVIDEMKADMDTWMVYACIASAVAVIVFLLALIMRKRIKLVVELFKEAGSALGSIPLLLIQPVWVKNPREFLNGFIMLWSPYREHVQAGITLGVTEARKPPHRDKTLLFLLIAIAGLALIALFLETAGQTTVDSTSGFVTYEFDEVMKYLRWYYLFGFLWITAFIVACQDLVVAGAVGIWYFRGDKKSLGCPICKSIYHLIRYHLGTVAFGSFIIAVVRFIRFVLSMVQKKLHGKTGKVAEFTMKVMQCCLWCFEKFIQFINRNAYIMTASHGYNFCTGARKAFMLLIANVLRVAALNSVGDFVLFLAKMGCSAIAVIISYQFFKVRQELVDGEMGPDALHYIWAPMTVAGAVAFVIVHCFMLIYEIALDTIFLCFCEDCEMNDGIAKPYFMSRNLMECIGNLEKDALNQAEKKKKKEEGTLA